MKRLGTLTLLSTALLVSACSNEENSAQAFGADPKLPAPERGLLPSMKIAEPTPWGKGVPTVPKGFTVTAIATTLGIIQGLRIFDQILALTGGGPAGATETLATEVYKQAFSLGQFGFGSALALVLTLIILVFAILQQYATRDRDARKA